MHNLDAIKRALDSPSFAAKRRVLREAADPILHSGKHEIVDAIKAQTTFDIRPAYSALRDAMSVETLTGVIVGQIGLNDIIHTLVNPKGECFAKPSAKSGYDIGRPRVFTDAAYQRICDAAKSHTTTGTTHMSGKLSLSDMMAVIDDIVIRKHHPLTIICEALIANGHSAEIVNAAADALRLRGETSEPPHLSRELADIVKATNAAIAGEETPAETPALAIPSDAAKAGMIDLALGNAGLPTLSDLIAQINEATQRAADAEARARATVVSIAPAVSEEKATGDIPKGKVRVKRAYDAFGLTSEGAKRMLDFDVPVWEWDGVHPHVPDADENYVFRPFELFRVLYAIITNQRAYLHGHTGTGKTTLIEQVAARLMWPVMRVNFDSEITRMDLIGRDVLTSEGGSTVSKFVDGILPQMMAGPYIGIFDEIDFVRPDVAYVMQRALEGNGLMLTEDGGRIVKPHRMFRMFATGNTVGQGDEHGMYQGARPQSMALLDRFTVWIKVDYMQASDRQKLIKAAAPNLSKSVVSQISQYVGEHLEAFTTSKVLQPISPRTYMAFAKAVETFTAIFPEAQHKDAVTQAVETTILDRASVQDRAVLVGIAQRVFS